MSLTSADDINGLFKAVYAPSVEQMRSSQKVAFENVLKAIDNYDSECVLWYTLNWWCKEQWFSGASDAIKILLVVTKVSGALKKIALKQTISLIVNEVYVQAKKKLGIPSYNDVLKAWKGIFTSREIDVLPLNLENACG